MTENTKNVCARIGTARVLPILTLERSESAFPLATALLAGGLPVAEITFRSDSAADSIRIVRERIPEMLIGAGTVLSVNQVELAQRAGSQFILTPGLNPAVVEASLELGMPVFPGVNNPTDIELAMGFGLETVKFFPAEASGGVPFLKALAGPYPAMRFLPTGGISPENLADYLALDNVLACGGSWIADSALIQASRYDDIARIAAEAAALSASSAGSPVAAD